MEEIKAWLALLFIRISYAGYYLLSKIAFDEGLNTFVFVFYRQAFATLFLAPFAVFFHWKMLPPMSFSIFFKIFMLSLIGVTVSLNIIGVGVKLTSASLAAAITNTLPVLTFLLAVLLRMEKVRIRTRPGMMKVAGMLLCIAGVATLAFYRGPSLKLLMHHHLIHNMNIQQHQAPSSKTWGIGVILLLLSLFTWALWIVLQGRVLKSYPSKLLLTTLLCFISTIQSFVTAVAFTRDFTQWKLGWNIQLLSAAYSGIVVSGVGYYLQTNVIEKKGPVFYAMGVPITLVSTIIMEALLMGEIVSLGSVLGALLLCGGLYSVLWGKKEEERAKVASQPTSEAEKAGEGSRVEIIA